VEFFRHAKKTEHGQFVSKVVTQIDTAAWPLFARWLPESAPGRVPQLAVLGCGSGDVVQALLRAEPRLGEWNVTGFDVDPEAIAMARGKNDNPRVSFETLDARELDARAPGTFDAIYCHGILDHCSGHRRLLQACSAALRQGGVFFVITPDRNWSTWLRFVFAGPRWVFDLGPWSGLHDFRRFPRPSELDGLARASGLVPVEDPEGGDTKAWRRGVDYRANPLEIYRAVRRRDAESLQFEVTGPKWWLGGFRGEFIAAFRKEAEEAQTNVGHR
jgi:2-polyprenyl-3-methyl-5-hydroxy-6-metoxy-1,4-benzoquinol methylase